MSARAAQSAQNRVDSDREAEIAKNGRETAAVRLRGGKSGNQALCARARERK